VIKNILFHFDADGSKKEALAAIEEAGITCQIELNARKS